MTNDKPAENKRYNKGWDNLTPYQIKPGEVRNPGGRPKKDREFMKLCQAAIQDHNLLTKLLEKLDSGALDFKEWLAGFKFLVERGYGRAIENVNINSEGSSNIKILIQQPLSEDEFKQKYLEVLGNGDVVESDE